MPLAVEFDTAPQLVQGLRARYGGTGKALLGYKDKATKTWTDLSLDTVFDRVDALTAFLHARGIRPGDRVAILSENRPEWAITDLATQMLGAVTVALYATVPAHQVAYICRDSGAKALIVSTGLQLRKANDAHPECPDLELVISMTEPKRVSESLPVVTWNDALAEGTPYRAEHASVLDAIADAVTPDDLSALIYTSGTTGNPKGVQMTHQTLCTNAKAAHERLPVYESDIHLSFLPLSHAFERTAGYTVPLSAGAQIVYAESVDAIAKNLPEVRPTLMVSVPRLFERVYTAIQKQVQSGNAVRRGVFAWAVDTGKAVADRQREGKAPGALLNAQYALAQKLVFSTLHEKLGGRVRFAVSGGAALPQQIGEFFEAAGVRLVEGYGLSETSPVLSANPLEAPRFGTVGHVFPGVTVAIRDLHSGQILGQVSGADYPTTLTTGAGEILARGETIMPGYWNRPDESEAVFDDDGWFKTGDVGRFEDGYLRITDRLKHMIVSRGGKNIYPGPIEEQLAGSPFVEQLMVIGEGRAYLTALVVPDMETVRAEAKARSLTASSEAELLADATVLSIYEDLFKTYSRQAASHEKVRDFRFAAEPFTVENELLTPTLKLKRRAIEAANADVINEMYQDVP
ncbi:MAG: long-chain fatty acid--CoA ligase [Bacteroidota bacterium]